MLARTLLLLIIFAAPTLRAQDLLPKQFGRWTATTPAKAALPAGDAQAVLAESQLAKSEAREYTAPEGGIKITAYRFHDSSGAYQAYTFFFQPGAQQLARLEYLQSGDTRIFISSNILLVVENGAALSESETKELASAVRAIADKTPGPPIANYLPNIRALIGGTQRYALGTAGFRAATAALGVGNYSVLANDIGFSSGAETMMANYGSSTLLLIEYPTPQLAGLHLIHLQQAMPPAAKPGTGIERKGSLLSIVLKPSTADFAERLRNSVNYETQVTWNEPAHTVTEPPITTMIAKIIIATGVFMLVAIVFGIAFGGVRVLTKKLFPGKVFDRPEQMDVLQLGLSGKRIKSRDFY